MSTVFTDATNTYIATFHNYEAQFISWGQWIFLGLLTINLVWLCIWCAFDKASISESLSEFIKNFFLATIFYTILLHPEWAESVMNTSISMGSKLTGSPVEPSNIVSQGIAMSGKILKPIEDAGFFDIGIGWVIALIVYICLLFVFINIALDVALLMITTSALITVSCFFLGLGGLGATSAIARQSLDVILGNCVKLLGYYVVVGAGIKTIGLMTSSLPATVDALKAEGFDSYVWLMSVSWLFYLLSKNLPEQMAKIVSSGIQETRGTDSAAIAMSAVKVAGSAISGIASVVSGISGYLADKKSSQLETLAKSAESANSPGATISGQPDAGGDATKLPTSVPKASGGGDNNKGPDADATSSYAGGGDGKASESGTSNNASDSASATSIPKADSVNNVPVPDSGTSDALSVENSPATSTNFPDNVSKPNVATPPSSISERLSVPPMPPSEPKNEKAIC